MGDQAHEEVDYMSSIDIEHVSKLEVESNPVGMLTGVGLFWDTISCGSSCAKESKPLAIRANDYFEPEEKGEYCGKYSHYRMEEGEDINPACCGDYIYNKNTQVCNDQQIGPLFIDCGDAPTQYADKLECADGTFVDIFDEGWDGCLNKGSYRVRCPYPYIACEEMREVNGVETKDFHCEITCSNHEGKRKTCNRGKILSLLEDFHLLANYERAKSQIRVSAGRLGETRDDPDKLQDWATEWQKILDDQLYIFHNIIIEGSPSLIEKLTENSEFQVNQDDIHTETVARLVTDYFRTLTAEQTKGYELLLQANNYLYGASGNNDIYKLMVERFHEQGEKFKAVREDSKSIDQNLIRLDKYNRGDTFAMNDHKYVHLEAVEADEGKVVTGFQLYYKNNRLVVKIKQGTLREMGVIENNDWKSEDSYSWSSIHGENYIKYYDGDGTKKTDYHYIDFGFYQADVGRTIVGIKFCIENNRVALCVKTMKVDFASGTLSDKSYWEHTPKKWGDQAHEKVDYMSSLHISYVSKREVESNPVGMLTGVGLFWDTISCGSSCAKESKPLAIRANDYFEPE